MIPSEAKPSPAQSEPEWTPGPWRVGLEDRGSCTIRAADGELVAEAWLTRFRRHDANARLIAAAPDLYAELRHLVRLLEPMEQAATLNVPGLATLNGARAALALAERGMS